ncbi:MazG family protein [Microbacterium betulae]|uniref:MazG family protein n=1 Tax=Microbacterium betulae TaxID=2981139 RepID=A0AA97FMX8_9MICO|nr:MazG family protein [Microbacterium sp. AB]WOF24352.1 MazG family protein [Microbacterium sp. AB]
MSMRGDDTASAASGGADGLQRAASIMRQVRERCVWTQAMTHRELVPYLVEESAEVIDAVEAGDRAGLREELGDLLWQVLFHAEIAAHDPDDPFDIDDVAGALSEKMVRRHPHVFADEVAETPERVLELWNAAKATEKSARTSVLDGVSHAMPALALAQKVLAKGEKIGVGLEYVEAIAAAEAIADEDGMEGVLPISEEELGDTLVGLVAVARSRGWDAERALRTAVRAIEADIRSAEAG